MSAGVDFLKNSEMEKALIKYHFFMGESFTECCKCTPDRLV